jgi:hypothetical protein
MTPKTSLSPSALLHTSKAYAGIGSRSTPAAILRVMASLGETLAEAGLTLRSGGSTGADAAFEAGCDLKEGPKEIYLPWRGFNEHPSFLYSPCRAAFLLARFLHPAWDACSPAARRLHARNCQQILGKSVLSPVDFVLYWAPERDGVVQGGTAMAITLARRLRIPCFNLQGSVLEEWQKLV